MVKRKVIDIEKDLVSSVINYLKELEERCRYVDILINHFEKKINYNINEIVFEGIKEELKDSLQGTYGHIEIYIEELSEIKSVKNEHYGEIYKKLNQVYDDYENLDLEQILDELKDNISEFNKDNIKYEKIKVKAPGGKVSNKRNRLINIAKEHKNLGWDVERIRKLINEHYVESKLDAVSERTIERWIKNE